VALDRQREPVVSPLAFLLIALVLSVGGAVVLWARNRQPRSYDAGIQAFRREMEALAPPEDQPPPRRRGWRS
jgi:hypothetical protein